MKGSFVLTGALDVLKNVFGYSSFRRGQEDIINRITSGQDVLAVMPTGAGKSLCYQIPAILSEGTAIIISPLISLMKDQVDSLVQNGVRAASINSSMNWDEVSDIFRQVRRGELSMLYIAPERLEGEGFLEFFNSIEAGLVVVDEAHCVSQWGHDFRPAYLNIAPAINSLSKRPVVAAFTATATPEVRDDISSQLELKNPYMITTGFDRENLFFRVEHPTDKFSYLLDYIKKIPNASGIVYCSTRKNVESVCEKLNKNGISTVRYHAGLSDDERRENQESFIYDRADVIVATNAFGMGIDKSNVRYVVHYNMPSNMDAYYQEAGRAGRDGLPSECVLLFGAKDIMTARFFISQSDDKEMKESSYRKLNAMVDYCNTCGCLRYYILNYFGEKDAPKSCKSCGSCVASSELVDVTTESKMVLSCVYRMAEKSGGRKFGSSMLADVIRGSNRAQIKDLGFNEISTWGLLKERSSDMVRSLINFLVAEEYLRVDDGEFPVISFTDKSLPFLKGGTVLRMRKTEERAGKKVSSRTVKPVLAENDELFEILRSLRRTIAKNEGVAPYVVFSDRTLYAMCEIMPSNAEEFLEVPGVGETKLKRYGEAFMRAIEEHKNSK